MPDNIIRLSVRELTDFILRTGSVDSRSGVARMLEGTRLDELYFHLPGSADYILDAEAA